MLKRIIISALITSCLLQPSPAFAGGNHGRGGHYYHGGGNQGLAIASLAVGGAALLYSASLFYRSTPSYVVMQPPIGTIIPALPSGYTVYYANGMPYYYYSNTYYVPAPNGYVVAAPPVAPAMPQAPAYQAAMPQPAAPQTVAPAQAPAAPVVSQTPDDAFEIRLSNGNGSYTSITLRKTNQGFLGPQGEFYSDHPTEDQLRQRYVRL
jgi:hypothetical protein